MKAIPPAVSVLTFLLALYLLSGSNIGSLPFTAFLIPAVISVAVFFAVQFALFRLRP